MSAVGNDGRVYCLSKTDRANSAAYRLFMRDQCRQKRFLGKYSYFYVASKTFDASKLTNKERETLQNQLSSFCESCASGGAFYGFKYTKKMNIQKNRLLNFGNGTKKPSPTPKKNGIIGFLMAEWMRTGFPPLLLKKYLRIWGC